MDQITLFGKDLTTGAISTVKVQGNVVITSAGTLDNLTDVVITSPSANQILKYSSPNWVNGSIATSNLSDVSYGSLASGDLLTYNGSNWSNAQPANKDYIVINMHGTTASTVYSTNTFKQIMAGTSANYSGTLPNPATNTLGNMSSRTTPISSVFETSTGFITINSSRQYVVTAVINQTGNITSPTQVELAIYNVVSGTPTAFSPNFINIGRVDTDFAGMGITTTAFVSGTDKIVVMFRYVTAQGVSVNPIDTSISVTIIQV